MKAKHKKGQSKNKAIWPLLAGAAILAIFGYRYFRPPKETEVLQVTGGTGTVVLALTPASSTLAANATTDLTLTIDAGTGKVSAVQVELAYLAGKCVTPITVTKGDFLTVVLAAPTVTNNKIKFTYAAPPASGGKQGTGTLAKITTGPTTGSCVLSFTNNTLAAAIGAETNALASASDAAINLPGAAVSPSPNPSVSPLPSASPSFQERAIRKAIDKWGPAMVCKHFGVCNE